MSNKTLSNAELELTQKIQMYFPRGVIDPEVMNVWNGMKAETITSVLGDFFKKIPYPILEFVGTVDILATAEKFIAGDRFTVNTSDDAPVKILGLSNRFEEEFLDKIEKPIGEINLYYSKLLRNSVDNFIIEELGGEEEAETTLIEMFSLMEKQCDGENGVLLTSGYANIFYIRNSAGVLRAVYCYWLVFGWRVAACQVGDPHGWSADRQVFSRSSLES